VAQSRSGKEYLRMMHLVLCPGCGYSFWTTEIPTDGHCMKPYDPMRSDYASNIYPWLVDKDAIDFIANPGLVGYGT
jgi:hypothetical protein